MGKKKECSCGYWNKDQEECLYSGNGCAKDKQSKLKITREWVEKKANKAIEVVLTGGNVQDFIRSFIKELE